MKTQLCVFGKVSKECCLASLSMVRTVRRLYKKSSPLFLSQYLKAVSMQLMWYWGGCLEEKPEFEVYVALTRSGIPLFVPPFYRKVLRRRSNPLVLRFILSFCSLSKLILVWPSGKKVSPKTIHIPKYKPTDAVMSWCETLLVSTCDMLKAYTNNMYTKIPLELGFS